MRLMCLETRVHVSEEFLAVGHFNVLDARYVFTSCKLDGWSST